MTRVRLPLLVALASSALLVPRLLAESADPPAAADAFAPQLATAADGALLTWIEPAASGNDLQRVRFSRWRAGAWSPPVTIVESAGLFANWADTPGVTSAPGGELVAWWLARLGAAPYAYGVATARSTDGGANWSQLGWLHEDRSSTEHGFVSMVADGAGLRAFWLDGRATAEGRPMQLRTAIVTVGDREERLVDGSVCDCCGTAAAFAAAPLVAYRDRTPEEIRDVRVARLAGSGEPPTAAVARDEWKIAGCPVNGPAMAAMSPSDVAVAWFAAPDDRARVALAFSADGGASFGEPLMIDDRQPIGRVALAVPRDTGEASVVLAWLARREGRAELRLERVASDGRRSPAVALGVTAASRRSGFPRLAALGDGRLLVAWTASGEGASRLRAEVLDAPGLPPR